MSIKNSKRSIYLPIALAIAVIGGFLLGIKLAPVTSSGEGALFIKTNSYNKVNDIINYIEQDYVDSLSRQELEQLAISGVLESLDPHSSYISSDEFNDVNDPLVGNFEGIGIQFRIEKDTITVIHTIPGGPSEKVGLMAGDRLVIIDDSLVAGVGVTSDDAVKMLKGPRGTKVEVGVKRKNHDENLEFTIIRDVIPTWSVDIAYMVDEKIGYIKVSRFAATTYDEFMSAMKSLISKGMKGLILDLRGNYGGYLTAAIEMADEFLADELLIVYTEGTNRPNNYAYASPRGLFERNDLVILIDEGSASASEIVAGAVQDNDRGWVVGRRSFGKGLVQEQLNLPDGSALRLTVARYHTPTGRNIQKSYEEGTDSYYEEFYHRFMNGEMENADSIEFDDSLKYVTPGGKIVYGGGGIMPDIFVPVNTSDDLAFYDSMVRRNIIFQFAFDYTDNNREKLLAYDSPEDFKENFIVSAEMYNQLLDFAKSEGVNGKKKDIRASEERIKSLLKAYIGRNHLDDEGFYPTYHGIDEAFQAGYHVLIGEE